METSPEKLTLPVEVPPEKRAMLTALTEQLAAIPGLQAVVLGGSYAQGTQRPESDLDLGLYYREQSPFAIDAIRQVASAISPDQPPVVTDFYEWGAWVNGGAWIHTAAGKVDFLYRNLDHVRRVISDAQAGKVALDYAQQPPYGFRSVIYLAETHICLPLVDPVGTIADLKRAVIPYPSRLKAGVIHNSLWSVEFTLLHARSFAGQGDVYNTVGCLTRALSDLTQVLFALNEAYFISDKRALATIETFPLKPDAYAARVTDILAHPGGTAEALAQTVDALSALFRDAVELAGSAYQPKFAL
ncbi:MAG: nucleotidyltransferase domain-containing protein [Anaerolineae bacterium]|nr:nucleotidyltransferase domain-containing protein [Anaerolineae bacterium]